MDTPKRHHPCILGTCCIPWTPAFEFDEPTFRRSVHHQINSGIRDVYIFGTAGEGYAVTESQFDTITRVFLDITPTGMVGLISLSLPTVIARIERAHAMGARRFQLSLPSWGALNDTEMHTFFQETCGRFPDCQFLHYNLLRTGRLLTGKTYGVLADRHPNLVATKNSTADEARLRSLMLDAPQLQHFITEGGFPFAAMLGECGFLISYTSTNFTRAVEFYQAGRRQDAAAMAAISTDFPILTDILKVAVAGSAHMDGAYDKLFCRLHDSTFPLRLLPPYASVSEEAFQEYITTLRQCVPHWLP